MNGTYILVTCLVLFSSTHAMASDDGGEPKYTIVEIKSSEELVFLLSETNLSNNNTVYLLIPTSTNVSAQDVRNEKNITESGNNCKACSSNVGAGVDTPCLCNYNYIDRTSCPPCDYQRCFQGCSRGVCNTDSITHKWIDNKCVP